MLLAIKNWSLTQRQKVLDREDKKKLDLGKAGSYELAYQPFARNVFFFLEVDCKNKVLGFLTLGDIVEVTRTAKSNRKLLLDQNKEEYFLKKRLVLDFRRAGPMPQELEQEILKLPVVNLPRNIMTYEVERNDDTGYTDYYYYYYPVKLEELGKFRAICGRDQSGSAFISLLKSPGVVSTAFEMSKTEMKWAIIASNKKYPDSPEIQATGLRELVNAINQRFRFVNQEPRKCSACTFLNPTMAKNCEKGEKYLGDR